MERLKTNEKIVNIQVTESLKKKLKTEANNLDKALKLYVHEILTNRKGGKK